MGKVIVYSGTGSNVQTTVTATKAEPSAPSCVSYKKDTITPCIEFKTDAWEKCIEWTVDNPSIDLTSDEQPLPQDGCSIIDLPAISCAFINDEAPSIEKNLEPITSDPFGHFPDLKKIYVKDNDTVDLKIDNYDSNMTYYVYTNKDNLGFLFNPREPSNYAVWNNDDTVTVDIKDQLEGVYFEVWVWAISQDGACYSNRGTYTMMTMERSTTPYITTKPNVYYEKSSTLKIVVENYSDYENVSMIAEYGEYDNVDNYYELKLPIEEILYPEVTSFFANFTVKQKYKYEISVDYNVEVRPRPTNLTSMGRHVISSDVGTGSGKVYLAANGINTVLDDYGTPSISKHYCANGNYAWCCDNTACEVDQAYISVYGDGYVGSDMYGERIVYVDNITFFSDGYVYEKKDSCYCDNCHNCDYYYNPTDYQESADWLSYKWNRIYVGRLVGTF